MRVESLARKATEAMISRRLASLPLRPVRVFDDGDADKNRRIAQLERSHQDVARRLDQNKHDRPQPSSVKTSNYTARFGEYVKCDPTAGGFSVQLPRPTQADVGKHIWVKNISASANSINLVPVPPALIETGNSASISGGGGETTIVTDGRDYWMH